MSRVDVQRFLAEHLTSTWRCWEFGRLLFHNHYPTFFARRSGIIEPTAAVPSAARRRTIFHACQSRHRHRRAPTGRQSLRCMENQTAGHDGSNMFLLRVRSNHVGGAASEGRRVRD